MAVVDDHTKMEALVPVRSRQCAIADLTEGARLRIRSMPSTRGPLTECPAWAMIGRHERR
jgi:hypothetical protein